MKRHVILSRRTFILMTVGCLLSFALMVNTVRTVVAKESGDPYRHLKLFTDVLTLVQKNYVEPVDFEELVDGAVKGMLLSLDPHSGYLNRDVYKELQVETKGKFGGLGIEITIKDGLLTVVTPIEGSPASRSGVQAGDQIIKIGDEFTKNLSLIEAVKKMRGPKGSPIGISVHRDGVNSLIPITIVRDIIKVKSVRSRMLDQGFGYVRLAQFQEGSAKEFRSALKKLKSKNKDEELSGLVIDLRNNPGGLLTQAIRVGDIFLKNGIVVYTDGRLESQKQKYFAHVDGDEPEYPVIVLVNGGSASASEIVSGAFQDHGRALILGQPTFGKGSVQTILPMESGGALRLTTALYYTKSGRSIQSEGVTPDVVISARRYPSDREELLEEDESVRIPKEKDLPGAIKNPNRKKKSKREAKKSKSSVRTKAKESSSEKKIRIGSRDAMKADLSELLKSDPQLDEALRLLKVWKVFPGRPAIEAKKSFSPTA